MFARFRIPRPRFRFSLRTLILFTFACGTLLGWYARADRQRKTVEALCQEGSWCMYGSSLVSEKGEWFDPYEGHKSPILLNLFHRPRVFLGGIGGCSSIPPG